jgi:hypothetical protein
MRIGFIQRSILWAESKTKYAVKANRFIRLNLKTLFMPISLIQACFWAATINESQIAIYLEHMKEDIKQLKVQTE